VVALTARKRERSSALDALRGVAILLVLGSHQNAHPLWSRGGWMGVDLFFVLSGFLVAGLFFVEFKGTGRVDALRFLARRGFKIYPSFYLLIAVTVALRRSLGVGVDTRQVLAEVVFFQNYFPGLWGHTWSLAVEEHFYVLLAVFMLWQSRRRSASTFPFVALPGQIALLGGCCLAFRTATTWLLPFTLRTHCFQTHLRLDALAFGVLLSYWFHFREQPFEKFVRRWRWRILLASLVAASTPFWIGQDSVWMTTAGLSLIYVAFGGLLSVILLAPYRGQWWRPAELAIATLAFVGRSSYAIYLWHLVVASLGIRLWELGVGPVLGAASRLEVYVLGSVVLGWSVTRCVEQPFLSLRDRVVPSATSAVRAANARPRGPRFPPV
jgi:peptidoglycan/LPS O-acetylase OafA/YrhL